MNDWEWFKEQGELASWPGLVDQLVCRHIEKATWESLPLQFWLARLTGEVGELANAVVGEHEHPWELEALQVAAICINMLRLHSRPMHVLKEEWPK